MNMKQMIKKVVSTLSESTSALKVFQIIVDEMLSKVDHIEHNGVGMKFVTPNQITKFRSSTFSSKEPDTLEWIDSIPHGSVLWDIGANVGIYSIYAAKRSKCKVYAFEPSVFNLEFLARNIFLNKLQDDISIIPIALTNRNGVNIFQMSNTSWGGALSTFGESFDQFGNDINSAAFECSWPGATMDSLPAYLKIDKPDYVKIDVDGIEHLVIEGGLSVLKSVQSVLLEVNQDFDLQSDSIQTLLTDLGFSLFKTCDMGDNSFYNLWWIRGGNN